MKPLETQEDIVKYFGSPLEEPELHTELYFKPYHSKTDDLIKEILAKHNDGSRVRSPFSLLDSTVIIPPLFNNYLTAYYQEAYVYGDYIDLYIHEKPQIRYKNPRPKRSGVYSRIGIDRSSEYRRRNSIKALNKIRRLTLNNFNNDYVKLLTLTFGDCDFDITNPKICNKKLSKFLQKLRELFPDFKYLGVIEFQKRGAVHYHILCDLPFVDKERLAKMWKHGFIDIRKPDYVIGTYLFKYLAKDLNDEKLKGVRVYFRSKNLKKYLKVTGFSSFDLAKKLEGCKIHFTNSYVNKYNQDVIKYLQFKVSPAPN